MAAGDYGTLLLGGSSLRTIENDDGTESLVVVPFGSVGVTAAAAAATKDAGPSQSLTRTYTNSADMTTAAQITPAPATGQKIVAMDILVSTDTAMKFSIQMETSNNILTEVYLAANSSAQITLRGFIKGDANGKKLFGKASAAGNVGITVVSFSES